MIFFRNVQKKACSVSLLTDLVVFIAHASVSIELVDACGPVETWSTGAVVNLSGASLAFVAGLTLADKRAGGGNAVSVVVARV